MDSETTVLESPQREQQQEQAVMEQEVMSKLQTPEEPENLPAAEEEPKQLPVNGHGAEEAMDLNQTEEPIVTDNVTLLLSVEKPEMEIVEESLPTEKMEVEVESCSPTAEEPEIEIEESRPPTGKCDMESVPGEVASSPSPDPDESSEKVSDPVEAFNREAEIIQPEQQQQSVPENDPEPLPVQTPAADSVPEPEPEKMAESVPEAEQPQEQTLPEEPAALQQSPIKEEIVSEMAETELQTTFEVVEEFVPKKEAFLTEATVEEEKPAESVLAEELVSIEKLTEALTLKEEAPAEIVNVTPAEDVKKDVEPEKSVESGTVKGADAAEVESEKNDAEPQKEEEDTVPAAGSLAFALLEKEQTKDTMRSSRTLVVLRGLPGSGKSFLARAIADAYKDHCSIVCADDHGVKPENPETSADGYKALDEAVVSCAGNTASTLVVVDDTNHTQDRLARLGEIAEQHHLVAVFLEPRTEWSRDLAQLTKKAAKRGLEEAQLEAMRGSLEEMTLPLFYGWFLLSSVQEKVRCTSMDFLKTLDTLEAFKKHLIDFTGKAESEVDLEQYFQAKGTLHCTTKFCDYGKEEGAKEYALTPAVEGCYGSVFELSLSALFVTPRTVGARVSLTEEQLVLWPPADGEKEEAGSTASPLAPGSRAHVTLGCAEGVEPVQTGLDLLEILALQQEGRQGEPVEEMELGSLTYYGEGRWLLSLREPICAPACFSSFYGRKETKPTKKEPEKKKKQRCTIL